MSRKGDCWDNVKKEVDRVKEESNECRYRWGLKKMAPVQYRDHLLAA